jgi:hypothetical protein
MSIDLAYLQRCSYELGQHLDGGRDAGISPKQIAAVTSDGDLDLDTHARITVPRNP